MVPSLFLILTFVFPEKAMSRVIVDDAVAVQGEKLMLRAETKGQLFGKGGELVEFSVDGELVGKNLSGGDGVAFRGFTPRKKGLYEIVAKSGGDEDRGILLSLEKGTSIVFVDVEEGIFEDRLSLFSKKTRQGSQKAIEKLHERFPVVFLKTGFLSTKAMKLWLSEQQFPELPVLPWGDGKVFHEAVDKGLGVKAIIAGATVIKSANKYKPLAFSFEAVEHAEKVRDWEEIAERLKAE